MRLSRLSSQQCMDDTVLVAQYRCVPSLVRVEHSTVVLVYTLLHVHVHV